MYATIITVFKFMTIKKLLPKIKDMNSLFVCISILVKSNVSRQCLINFLNEVSSQSLRHYLKLANIYDRNSNKKKSDLTEMIIYGCMNEKLKNKRVEDISINKAYSILKQKDIIIKSLPGYGNLGLRKKDIKPYVEVNPLIYDFA